VGRSFRVGVQGDDSIAAVLGQDPIAVVLGQRQPETGGPLILPTPPLTDLLDLPGGRPSCTL
jgi:hypothetical protein